MSRVRPSASSRDATSAASREVDDEHQIDDALDASFPASDPPGWTLGRRARKPKSSMPTRTSDKPEH